MPSVTGEVPTAEGLREAFAAPSPPTVGLEEELMLLHPQTLDLQPLVPELLARAAGDARFKAELPAAQVEIAVAPSPTVSAASSGLRRARGDLLALADGLGLLAGAGVHPFASAVGPVTPAGSYTALVEEYGDVIRRQLVFGLHVHVAVRPVERAVAVHDALRSYLPELLALGANAPLHEGRDTGLCTWRPKIAETLPRQGIPPVLRSVEGWAAALAWGARAGALPGGTRWWWEMRLHPRFGTLEVRVPDTQTTVGETAALAAVVQCLAVALAERHAAGERLPVHDGWRIDANRWAACRSGVEASFADLDTGRPRPGRERLHALLDELEPVARSLRCTAELAAARGLIDAPSAARLRAVASERGPVGAAAWLAARFQA